MSESSRRRARVQAGRSAAPAHDSPRRERSRARIPPSRYRQRLRIPARCLGMKNGIVLHFWAQRAEARSASLRPRSTSRALIRTASLIAFPPSADEISIRSASGTSPFAADINAFEAEHRAHEAAHVAGIAIRVPARGANDRLRSCEVVGGVEQRHDHERMIGNDVAVAGMLVVSVARFDRFPRLAPVRIAFSPLPNVGDRASRSDRRTRPRRGRRRSGGRRRG